MQTSPKGRVTTCQPNARPCSAPLLPLLRIRRRSPKQNPLLNGRRAGRASARSRSICRPEAWKQLRMLSVQIESSTQALGEDAINLLFEKHRLNRIA